MKAIICPRCKTNLELSVNQAIEMDYCPACKGVWLDSGELDRILERSKSLTSPSIKSFEYDRRQDNLHGNENDDEFESEHDNRYDYGRPGYRNQTRRRKGFLSELFDF